MLTRQARLRHQVEHRKPCSRRAKLVVGQTARDNNIIKVMGWGITPAIRPSVPFNENGARSGEWQTFSSLLSMGTSSSRSNASGSSVGACVYSGREATLLPPRRTRRLWRMAKKIPMALAAAIARTTKITMAAMAPSLRPPWRGVGVGGTQTAASPKVQPTAHDVPVPANVVGPLFVPKRHLGARGRGRGRGDPELQRRPSMIHLHLPPSPPLPPILGCRVSESTRSAMRARSVKMWWLQQQREEGEEGKGRRGDGRAGRTGRCTNRSR